MTNTCKHCHQTITAVVWPDAGFRMAWLHTSSGRQRCTPGGSTVAEAS